MERILSVCPTPFPLLSQLQWHPGSRHFFTLCLSSRPPQRHSGLFASCLGVRQARENGGSAKNKSHMPLTGGQNQVFSAELGPLLQNQLPPETHRSPSLLSRATLCSKSMAGVVTPLPEAWRWGGGICPLPLLRSATTLAGGGRKKREHKGMLGFLN